MATVFEVQSEDINGLNDLSLTKLLKILLHLEARTSGIAERAVEVALNIRVADGGEDGRIEWVNGPDSTDFLPSRLVQFQNKATDMGPAACANEITASDGSLKPMVEQAFGAGGTYVLFTTQELNTQQIQDRIDAIRERLRTFGKPYADTANIRIYDAAKIQGWVNHYAAAITAVLNWVGKPLVNGLCTWGEWERFDENHLFDYVADQSRNDAINSLRALLVQPRKCARIIGLSGLGKTRLALEVCRGNDEDDGFSKRVVYIDAAYGEPNLAGLLNSWVRLGLDCLFVVDNCDLALHKQLRREVEHPNSTVSLLTLHYNPEKDPETDPVQLNTMSDGLIKAMLEPVYGEKINDLDRIVGFAQGFPQMAVLLAKARLDQTRDMGSLTDDDLVKKMLWGGGAPDQQATSVLEACALFDKFGIEKEREDEARFIAEQIAGTDIDALYRCISAYEKRGIVNRAGRLAQIIPKPLAIRLAADWWRATRTERQQELIETEMPGQLERSFCDQVAKLDFLPEVKELTQNLCGDQGPFGQAEVILSTRGSRLFRSLVEVNPKATSDVLYKVLSKYSHEQLHEISGEVRRNLVWALEKLCFHKEVFGKSAKCMMWLAASENEAWANNATGQFLQLFRTFLSGTEAPPPDRLAILDEALHEGGAEERVLVVRALETVIDTYGGARTVGAEYQGSGEPLVEWRPDVWQEAFDYWIEAIKRLTALALESSDISNIAKDAIGTHIRGLVQRSEAVTRQLDISIREIVAAHGPLWQKALDSIKTSLSFDAKKMPHELREVIDKWVQLLTPVDIDDRVSLIVTNPPYEHAKDDENCTIDVAANNAEAFAAEFSSNISVLVPYIQNMLVGEQRQAYWFGRCLVTYSGEWEPLLTESIRSVQEVENPNINFLLGLLDGLFHTNPEAWEEYLAIFAENDGLKKYFANVIRTGQVTTEHLATAVELISSGALAEASLSAFTYGRALEHLNPELLSDFIRHFRVVSQKAAWVSLDILSMYCHGDNEKWEACAPMFKEILIDLPLAREEQAQQQDVYHWQVAVEKILSDGDIEFIQKLVERIISSCKEEIDFGDLHYYIKPTLRKILGAYGPDVWHYFADGIRESNGLELYRLTQLLASEDSFNKTEPSVLSELPDEVVIEWCMSEPIKAPEFVAMATEVFNVEDNRATLSDRARILLDEFGHDKNVISALSANMGSFGWSGSLVPRYEMEITVLEPLLGHKHNLVREWAEGKIKYLRKAIESETTRDQEAEWGIY